MRAVVLGCGSSGGIPRIGGPDGGGNWGDCDPDNPKNRRRRCSLLVEQDDTRVLIDTGPDLVPQLLDARVSTLDGVVYTHAHADHTHGVDDLRQVVFNAGRILPLWADEDTARSLITRFGYIFETPPGSGYPPIATLCPITGPFDIGPLRLTPFRVAHGAITALGFRIEAGGRALVYLPDVSDIPDAAWPTIEGADVFICDALRRKPHPSHAHLPLTLEWMARAAPRRGIITNMHLDMDYDAVDRDTPPHITPAFDGMVITL